MKALIADDDVFVRKCITQMLPWQELEFSQVMEAENGAVALRIIMEEKPDLIISDIKMPILSGLELAQRLRSSVVDNCFIILSEYSDFEFVQQALTYGVQDYLLKPITKERLDEISEKIRQHMAQLEKKRYYTSLKVNLDDIRKLVSDMIDSGDAQPCAEAFEYIALHEIHIEDLKRFGMMFLNELYDQFQRASFQKGDAAETRERAMAAYSRLKKVSDMIAFVREQCEDCAQSCARRAPHTANYVARIVDYSEKNYADPNLSVATVSDWLHLSPVYCGTLYKQQQGESIITYIHKVRMRHAQELLRDGSINVANVSKRVGYMTPDYFSRLFSASFGMSPSQYRSAMVGQESET